MNIDIEGHEYLCFIPPPWEGTGQIPIEWFRKHFPRFLYSETHILSQAMPYEINDGPNRGGIYFLVEQTKIIYVGKANSVRARLVQHWTDKKPFTHYWCLGGMPALFVEDIETFYIYYLEPCLNEKYPPIYEHFIRSYIESAKAGNLFNV